MKIINTLLLLPAVTDKRIIEIKHIKYEEACNFLHLFTTQLINNKSLTVTDYLTGLKAEMEFLHPSVLQTFYEEVDIRGIVYQPLYEEALTKLKELGCISFNSIKYKRAL